MTNYERIKAMSVEELAEFLNNISDCDNGCACGMDFCNIANKDENIGCTETMYICLNQESEDDNEKSSV